MIRFFQGGPDYRITVKVRNPEYEGEPADKKLRKQIAEKIAGQIMQIENVDSLIVEGANYGFCEFCHHEWKMTDHHMIFCCDKLAEESYGDSPKKKLRDDLEAILKNSNGNTVDKIIEYFSEKQVD